MSIEYRAAGQIPTGARQSLLDALAAQPEFIVVTRDEGSASLRYADVPPREKWPEDFAVTIEPDGLRVMVHGGSRAHRERVVARIEALLTSAGVQARLEEL